MALIETLQAFAEKCNHHPQLRRMNADWQRVVSVCATDVPEQAWLYSDGGSLWATADPAQQPADLVVEAPQQILEDVFSGRLTPTEPYNQGDLLVRGSQDDLLRLDVITLLLWGE